MIISCYNCLAEVRMLPELVFPEQWSLGGGISGCIRRMEPIENCYNTGKITSIREVVSGKSLQQVAYVDFSKQNNDKNMVII